MTWIDAFWEAPSTDVEWLPRSWSQKEWTKRMPQIAVTGIMFAPSRTWQMHSVATAVLHVCTSKGMFASSWCCSLCWHPYEVIALLWFHHFCACILAAKKNNKQGPTLQTFSPARRPHSSGGCSHATYVPGILTNRHSLRRWGFCSAFILHWAKARVTWVFFNHVMEQLSKRTNICEVQNPGTERQVLWQKNLRGSWPESLLDQYVQHEFFDRWDEI